MKKLVISFVLIFFLFPIVSAIEFDMKTNFSLGETLIAKISGEFPQALTPEDFIFYRRHIPTSIIFEIVKIDSDYYFYASLEDKIPDNYSIVVGEFSQNFTILEEQADFSVNPGFVITDKDFSLEIKNLKESNIGLKSKFNGKEINLSFSPKEIRKIEFDITAIEETSLQMIELSTENLSYKIPVYIFVSDAVTEVPEEQPEKNQTPENKSVVSEEKNLTVKKEIISASTTQTCSEMKGAICKKDIEKCDGESAYAKDNVCCLSSCLKIEKSSIYKILGWSILILIILIIIFVRKKYKGVKPNIDLLKVAKGKN